MNLIGELKRDFPDTFRMWSLDRNPRSPQQLLSSPLLVSLLSELHEGNTDLEDVLRRKNEFHQRLSKGPFFIREIHPRADAELIGLRFLRKRTSLGEADRFYSDWLQLGIADQKLWSQRILPPSHRLPLQEIPELDDQMPLSSFGPHTKSVISWARPSDGFFITSDQGAQLYKRKLSYVNQFYEALGEQLQLVYEQDGNFPNVSHICAFDEVVQDLDHRQYLRPVAITYSNDPNDRFFRKWVKNKDELYEEPTLSFKVLEGAGEIIGISIFSQRVFAGFSQGGILEVIEREGQLVCHQRFGGRPIDNVKATSFHVVAKGIFIGYEDGEIRQFSSQGIATNTYTHHLNEAVTCLEVVDGWLFSGSNEGSVAYSNLSSLEDVKRFSVYQGSISYLHVVDDQIIAGRSDGRVQILRGYRNDLDNNLDLVEYFPDGTTYRGERNDEGEMHGKGILTGLKAFKDWGRYGYRYDGIWENGKFIQGEYTSPEEVIYEIQEKLQIGGLCKVIIRYSNGSLYEGEFTFGSTLVRLNGEYCEGVPFGKDGVMTYSASSGYPEGTSYKGEWEVCGDTCYRHGQGVLSWPTGDVYDGSWFGDKISGMGKFLYRNGDVYDGQWMYNMKHGEGELIDSNNNIKLKGRWEHDQFLTEADPDWRSV